MGTRPKALAAVTVVLLAGVAVVGVNRWRHRDQIIVIGDSMSVFAGSELRNAGEAVGYDVSVDAQIGVPLAARLDTIQRTASSGAQRIVVELGSNDVLTNTPAATLDSLIDQAVTDVQSVRCVVFVNVGFLAGPVELAHHFNNHLHDDIALHSNEHEYDWSSAYQQHPDWTADNLHLQTPYWPFYAHGIIDNVHQFCH